MLKNERDAISGLSGFIKRLVSDGVLDRNGYKEWKKHNESFVRKVFGFKASWPIPSASSLVQPFFHPSEPFIGLNYTPLAHNTLYKFPKGWTVPLRLCRGIIFNSNGDLVAKPFPKFFNFEEHPETTGGDNFSKQFFVTEKMDGHLGIIFMYDGNFYITTRGSFNSKTSKLATEMLSDASSRFGWHSAFNTGKSVNKRTTILVEIIHPETKVLTNYGRAKKFVLIGAYDCDSLVDHGVSDLLAIGKELSLDVTKCREENSLPKILKEMKDVSIANREGYVVRLSSGKRIKFKFKRYIGKMVEEKLSYSYLMKRMISGNLDKMIETLPEELYDKAREMVRNVKKALRMKGDIKLKRQYLYDLVSKKESTTYYRSICREFLKKFSK